MVDERKVYPHPDDFAVKRPEYREKEDGLIEAKIEITPFEVKGESVSKAGARRAALRRAEQNYKSYHPGYEVTNPYPEEFVDKEGTHWERLSAMERGDLGDYAFTDDAGTDYVDIEQMLLWDVRVDEEGPADDEREQEEVEAE